MLMRALTDAETALISEFRERGDASAAVYLTERGLPTRRNEQWKWSDLRAGVRGLQEYGPDIRAMAPPSLVEDVQARGDIAGILACGLAEWALVNPPRSDGWITVRDRGVLQLDVGPEENVILFETYNIDRHLSTGYTSARVAEGGSLTRIVWQAEDMGEAGVFGAHVTVGANAKFRQFIFAEGASVSRIETRVDVEGEGANVQLNGVYLCGARRHADLTSIINHRVANGTTRQLIKGASRKGGRGVFQGRIEVARGAQKTDARQYHHGLLLEEGAEIYAKPELEIYADDVQCAHGNTAGALDEAALFYMRSRGIGEAAARALLTEAFLLEAVPEDLPGRDEIVARIQAWLGGVS